MCSIGLIAVLASIFLLPEKPGDDAAPLVTETDDY